jgi:glucan phosphoethanolaminetransferase (alkaline phosphatase superfamily)
MPPEVPGIFPGIDVTAALKLPLRFSVSSDILLLAFALVVVFWGVMAAIFIYHWRRFPYDRPLLRAGERLFISVSIVLIVVALGGIVIS